MGHTPEQRDTHPLCGAKKKNGEKCRAFAGQNTDHFGYGKCWVHGGATATHKKAALIAQTKQRMVALSLPVENAEPNAILLQELRNQAGHVAFINAELAAMDEENLGDDRSRVLLERLDNERDRLHRLASECAKAGIAAEAVRLQEEHIGQWAKQVLQAMREAGMSEAQVEAMGLALRIILMREQGNVAMVEAETARLNEAKAKIAEKDRKRVEREAQRLAGLVPASEMGMAVIEATGRDVSQP